jgi:hypothetical protein
LLDKALQQVVALPKDQQDAITSQILALLADEYAWKNRLYLRGRRAEALTPHAPYCFGLSAATTGSTFTPSRTASPGFGIIVSPSESPLSTSSLSP